MNLKCKGYFQEKTKKYHLTYFALLYYLFHLRCYYSWSTDFVLVVGRNDSCVARRLALLVRQSPQNTAPSMVYTCQSGEGHLQQQATGRDTFLSRAGHSRLALDLPPWTIHIFPLGPGHRCVKGILLSRTCKISPD